MSFPKAGPPPRFSIEHFDYKAQKWRKIDTADTKVEADRAYWKAWSKFGSRRVRLRDRAGVS